MKRSTKRRAEVRTCARAGCGGLFEWTPRAGQQQRYCTAACRQRAYRKRHCVPAGAEGPAADQATPAGGPGALTPFARRLSEAIRSSGLTLRQVQDGVAAGGGYVAASTLSTWQTGCGSPRGEDGFRRVLALERFLGTDPGDLTEPWRQSEPEPARPAAVQTPVSRGPRSPRRRPAGSGVAALTKDRRAWLEDAIAIAGGHASRTGLILTAQDHHYVVGPDRRPRMSRVLLEACAFKPDISSYWFPYTRHQHETTTFVPADNCGLGRTIHEQQYRSGSIDDAEIFAATEIVFDHPLELYTPYRFSFTVAYRYAPGAGDPPSTGQFRRLISSPNARSLTVAISFPRCAPPGQLVRCTWQKDRYDDEPVYGETIEVPYDVRTVTNPPPGGYGWRWSWSTDHGWLAGRPAGHTVPGVGQHARSLGNSPPTRRPSRRAS